MQKLMDEDAQVMPSTQALVYLDLAITVRKPKRLVTPELAFQHGDGFSFHRVARTAATNAFVAPRTFLAMAASECFGLRRIEAAILVLKSFVGAGEFSSTR